MENRFFEYLMKGIKRDLIVKPNNENKLILTEENSNAKLKKINIRCKQTDRVFLVKFDIESLHHVSIIKDKYPVVDWILIALKDSKVYFIYVEMKSDVPDNIDIKNKYFFSSKYMDLIKELYINKNFPSSLDINYRFLTCIYNKNSNHRSQGKYFSSSCKEKFAVRNDFTFNLQEFLY